MSCLYVIQQGKNKGLIKNDFFCSEKQTYEQSTNYQFIIKFAFQE